MSPFEKGETMEGKMVKPEFLREKAERCHRLMRAIGAQDVIAKLLELGLKYEQEA